MATHEVLRLLPTADRLNSDGARINRARSFAGMQIKGLKMKMTTIALLAALAASPAHSGDLRAQVRKSALRHGVPPELAHGVVSVETGYRNVRASDGKSVGIMQVRPATARGVGVRGSQMNPANSIEAGMRYLAQALKKFAGNWCVAASAYNRGLHARPRCTAYGRKVLALSRRHYATAED